MLYTCIGLALSTWLAVLVLIRASDDSDTRCLSSHVPYFCSRALFLSRKRCLAAVIESSVFRFDILTTSLEVSETTRSKQKLGN